MWFFLVACGPSRDAVPVFEVQQGTFEHTLAIAGSLEPVQETHIRMPSFESETKIVWMKPNGSRVREGEVVVRFDRSAMERDLEQAQRELEIAQLKLAQNEAAHAIAVQDAEAEIRRAELDLQVAEMRRTDSETVPLVEREQARVAARKAELAIASARTALETLEMEARAEREKLLLEIEEARRTVEAMEEDLRESELRAPFDGLFLRKRNWRGEFITEGDSPWSGTALASIPDLSVMEVDGLVHEVDGPLVAEGQRATVFIEAFPDRPVGGTLSEVAEVAVEKEGKVRMLDVVVSLDETRPEMLPGLSVRVEIEVERREDVRWIPIEAVHREEEGDSWVWVRGLTGFYRQDLELGVENDVHVVVLEGLDVGDEVALVDPGGSERPAADL